MDHDRFGFDRRATEFSVDIVRQVGPEQLDGPTPCGPWTVRELLGHMTAHNRGFAAAAGGTPVGGEVWDSVETADDPVAEYAESAAAHLAAFSSATLPEAIEVYGYGTFSHRTALGMHIVDYVVHGWDVAVSIGVKADPDEDLVAVAYDIMVNFPASPRPNKAFGVHVAVADEAPVLDKLLGFVGRDPFWRPVG